MNTLRLSRVVGFGAKPPQDFDQSPVTLGTASSCAIRFDPVFDRGVAPQHARCEWNGEAWYLLDLGSPEGTWVEGRRLTEASRVSGAMEFSLGQKGPKVKVELLGGSSDIPAHVPVREVVVPPPPKLPAAQTASPGRKPLLVAGAAAALVVGAGLWFVLKPAEKRPGFAQVLQSADEVSGSSQAPVEVVVAQNDPPPAVEAPSTPPPTPAPVETPPPERPSPIPEELRADVEELKKSSWQQAVREFWTETKTRSPYAKAILAREDVWLANQIPWLIKFRESGGVSTGRGMDFPGAFVPESVYPDSSWLGVPGSTSDISTVVGAAVAESAPTGAGANVATLSLAADARRLPSKVALKQKFQTYASPQSVGAKDGKAPQAHAFFVGINRFEDPGANLTGCRNDVGAQAKVLTTQGIFQPENLRLLTDALKGTKDYPSKENVVAALTKLVETAGPGDVIYLGFSTHGGFDEERKDAFLLMADMTYLYGRELTAILAKARAKNIVITMDACHTGGMPGLGGTQFADGSKSVRSIPDSFYQMLGSSRGHVVIRACRADQTTPDVRTLGHGILTTAIIAGLTGDADSNGDGIVTLSELRIYVTTAIPKISRRAVELGADPEGGPLEPTFTSSSFGEAGDLPLTVVEPKMN